MTKPGKPKNEETDAVLGMNKVIRYTQENTGMFGGWGPRIRL